MSRMTIASTNARIDTLDAKLDSILDAITGGAEAPAPTPKVAKNNKDEVFASKFQTQLPRAIALAKKQGSDARLVAVPKGTGTSVWYIGANRKVPQRGTLLATVRPDGSVKSHVTGVDSLVKAAS